MSDKRAYIEKREAELQELEAEISRFQAKAKKAKAEVRQTHQELVERLNREYEQSKSRLKKLREASGDAWDDMRSGFEKGFTEMRRAVSEATNEFRSDDD